jgi:hypothetical protein
MTETYKDYKIEITQDNIGESPREWDNFGKMIAFHGRYTLGDKNDYSSDNYNGWEELKEQLMKDYKTDIILPVYMYDHSGITIATTPFSCNWDSGQIGWIVADIETIKKEHNWKSVGTKRKEEVFKWLNSEIKCYAQYLEGDVYHYRVTDKHGEEIDSCGGVYGYNEVEDICKEVVDTEIAERKKIIEVV